MARRAASYILVLGMRRALSLSLLMMFSWMLIAPLLAPDADANLPACCRGKGKHHCHCMMSRMGRLSGNQKGFTAVSEKCPCGPAVPCAVHSATFKPEARARFYSEAVPSPARVALAEARPRLSFLRSHQRRGPPAPLT